MREFTSKRKGRRLLYSWPVIIIMLIILLFLGKANWDMYERVEESKQKRELVLGKLDELNDQKERIEGELLQLNSKVGVEGELRERFSLVKENENVIVIVDEKTSTTTGTTNQVKQNFWEKIKSIFK